MKTREMCFVALMAALMCIVSPFTIPVGPIPLSLATLTVYLAGALLGAKKGVFAVLLYILIGAVGVPVFSGFSGGFQKLAGVTGGYLVGYIPCALTIGLAADRWGERKWAFPVSMIIGTALLYFVGTAWFMVQMPVSLGAALASCVLPFLPGDAMKIVAVSVLAILLRKRLLALQ